MKIIAIMPAKNEAWILEKSLAVMEGFCDHIIVALDHCSDRSQAICEAFTKVDFIMVDDSSPSIARQKNRRQDLLSKAREYGENNIIFAVDADEIISSEVITRKDEFVAALNALKPGQGAFVPFREVWFDASYFRDGDSIWAGRQMYCFFKDDGKHDYAEGNRHESRIPQAYIDNSIPCDCVNLIHYTRVSSNRYWSRMAHYLYEEYFFRNLAAWKANKFYVITKDQQEMRLSRIPDGWVSYWESIGIDLRTFDDAELNYFDIEILSGMNKYGVKKFRKLNIWDIDWEYKRQLALADWGDQIPREPIRDPRGIITFLGHAYINKTLKYPPWVLQYYLEKVGRLLRQMGLYEYVKRILG